MHQSDAWRATLRGGSRATVWSSASPATPASRPLAKLDSQWAYGMQVAPLSSSRMQTADSRGAANPAPTLGGGEGLDAHWMPAPSLSSVSAARIERAEAFESEQYVDELRVRWPKAKAEAIALRRERGSAFVCGLPLALWSGRVHLYGLSRECGRHAWGA